MRRLLAVASMQALLCPGRGANERAFSSGPVFNPAGQRTGTFNSVWRREKDGHWKIVLDNGCPPCNCAAAASPKPGS